VELVRLYSNPKAGLGAFPYLLGKATSARQSHTRPVSIQTQIHLNPDQATSLAAEYSDGKMIKELAQRYGVHRTTVTAQLRRLNVQFRQRGLTANDAAAAARLYAEGWSLARLGQRFLVDDMTVRRALLAIGVTMRSPHERRGRSR
jgi:hypothetical protein